ncbi:hypothetical protein E3A20_27210, partial [Planctomyces bekefii]
MTDSRLALRASNVTVEYEIREYGVKSLKELLVHKLRGKGGIKKLKAVNDVSLDLMRGQSLAIIGHNGSGKSTLLRALAGIIKPPHAKIEVHGRIASMIELGAGFDGELSGIENIRLSCLLMGLSLEEVETRIEQIVAFSELRDFIHMPVKNYSSGMYARLGFACTTAVDPDILLIDEVLAVGDSNFAKKCYDRLEQLRLRDTSVVLVSHSSDVVQQFCDRGVVMNKGRKVFEGDIWDALDFHERIMNSREEEALSAEAAAELKRKREIAAERAKANRGGGLSERPRFHVQGRAIQEAQAVETVDLARPFDLEFSVEGTKLDGIKGECFFGMEICVPSTFARIGGFGTEPQILVQKSDLVR